MSAPCPRCGRSDGRHSGYHEDEELPIKRGDRVRLRAGAELRTTRAARTLINKRSRIVTVHSVECGRSIPTGYADNGEPTWRHLADPSICWVGSGGYWHHARLEDGGAVKNLNPADVVKRLSLTWVYYDTSEKGWHIFTRVTYLDTVIIAKVMRAFGATMWTVESDLDADSELRYMRVCVR